MRAQGGDFLLISGHAKQSGRYLGVDNDSGAGDGTVRCAWDLDNNSPREAKAAWRLRIVGANTTPEGNVVLRVTLLNHRSYRYLQSRPDGYTFNPQLRSLFADKGTPDGDDALWDLIILPNKLFAIRSVSGHYLAATPDGHRARLANCHESIKCEQNGTPDHPVSCCNAHMRCDACSGLVGRRSCPSCCVSVAPATPTLPRYLIRSLSGGKYGMRRQCGMPKTATPSMGS